jgi:hypothetical protein
MYHFGCVYSCKGGFVRYIVMDIEGRRSVVSVALAAFFDAFLGTCARNNTLQLHKTKEETRYI